MTDLFFSRPNQPKYRKSAPFMVKAYSSGEDVAISLSAREKDRMKELELLTESLEKKSAGFTFEKQLTLDRYSLIYLATRKLIDSISKAISSFENLPHPDRILLLKGSISEMIFLWSVRALDVDQKSWILPCFQVTISLYII